MVSASHKNPSEICWMQKTKGINAKASCEAEVDLFIAIIPTAANTTPAPKLALAEKHITFFDFENDLDQHVRNQPQVPKNREKKM